LKHLSERKIHAVFHYVPLHSAVCGERYSRFHGSDVNTTKESERLIRLPIWFGINESEVDQVVNAVQEFFS